MKATKQRTKTSPIFPDERMQDSLEKIICRVQLLEQILDDANKYQTSLTPKQAETNKRILRSYVNQSDLEEIANKQIKIKELEKLGKNTTNLKSEYITKVLDKALPKKELEDIYYAVTDIIEQKEQTMLKFIENQLIRKFFVDGKGNQLEYEVLHTYEIRCQSCNETTLKADNVNTPRTDKEFFIKFKKRELDKDCETKKCNGETFYVSAGNQFKVIKDIVSKYAVEMGGRMKSAGRFVEKFIDIITNMNPERSNQMFDLAALRIIGIDEEACKYISDEIVKIARQNYGRIIEPEFKNFPRKDYKVSPDHSRIKINFPMKVSDFKGNFYNEVFEIQIMDQLAKHTEKENKKINHDRYVEKQEMLRREKRNPIYEHLKPYLMTIFNRMDLIMKTPKY
ncbi:MAG: hypothetical protein ABH828_04060 [archaeon]